jgi:hypothetical protein
MPRTVTARCSFVRPDGRRCRAHARTGRTLCIFHDPDCAARGAEARRRGGIASTAKGRPATLPPDTADAPLASVTEVAAFLALTLNQVRTGKLGVNVANSIFIGAGTLLKALERGDMEERLATLEARLGGRLNGRVA